ncbi:MAG: alpha/beta hydrolase [Porticoccaceae bacterium]|nr:alpha/beta hydrolase [Porticoccaceae bacterium]
MPLEPATAAILAAIAESGGPEYHELPVAESRAIYTESQSVPPTVAVYSVEDIMVDGPAGNIPVRIYRPHAMPAPMHVHFHGGGWVIGNLITHDEDCREICIASGCIVVAVDYRLAPEHPFPAAPEDCYAVACWASIYGVDFGAKVGPISIGGDSAGGNLAAAVALMARDRKGPDFALQLLLYPITESSMSSTSFQDNAEGYLLTKAMMTWFWDHYCPDVQQRNNPLVSPLLASDLSDLPPALVITAEFDPLRDEGEAYGKRMQAAGVEVEIRRFDGLIHAFFSLAGVLEAAREGVDLVGSSLRRAHGLGN